MNIVYAFIGPLPSYTIDTIHQLRLFYDGPAFLILNDYNNPSLSVLENTYHVTIIKYDDVYHHEFNTVVNLCYNKFCIVNSLKGREKLFIYSFERFFVLYNLMCEYKLENVFFVELDNLIYDDPRKWLPSFQQKGLAFMFDNYNRGASGVCYIKDTKSFETLLHYFTEFILYDTGFISEMDALYKFWQKHSADVQLLPIHWPTDTYPIETYSNFEAYNNTVFDAASMGIYLGGMDPHHTKGVIVKGLKGQWSLIDYTGYTFEWRLDKQGRKIPYVSDGAHWYKINNLHIHSKDLKPCMST
jgi:hypothetical protein